MSDWGWVTFAFVTVYGTLGAYTVSLLRRQRHLASKGQHQ